MRKVIIIVILFTSEAFTLSFNPVSAKGRNHTMKQDLEGQILFSFESIVSKAKPNQIETKIKL